MIAELEQKGRWLWTNKFSNAMRIKVVSPNFIMAVFFVLNHRIFLRFRWKWESSSLRPALGSNINENLVVLTSNLRQ